VDDRCRPFRLPPWHLSTPQADALFVIKPDQFDVALKKDHGITRLLLHRGRNKTEAVEIAAAIRNVTGFA
jgi:hypothetical protein